jgi:peptide/nickel transport system substrate-binding protein
MRKSSCHGNRQGAARCPLTALAIGALLLMALVAGRPPGALAADRPDQGGTVVWAVHEFMSSFDIHYDASYITGQPLAPLYNGLVTFDVYDNSKIVGDLAERWEVSHDRKRITFHLRRGVKFHDGSDFTCADAQYSLDRLADPARAYERFASALKQTYESSRCADDVTLVVSMKRPSAGFMTFLASSVAAVMKNGIDKRADRKSPAFLIGTGPFKYKSHTVGVDFQAQRNPNYWKPGVPHLDGYRSVVMSDLTKIFASFRARQITMTGIARHLERPEAEILKKEFPDAVVGLGPRACWDNYIMNVSVPPFNDVRVRKAVALATEREKMIEIAVEGWGLLGAFISPYLPFALPAEELKQFPQFQPNMDRRRAEAKRLLAEAGYAKGLTVELLLRQGPLYERGALSRQDDLKKVGITEKILLLDTAAERQRTLKGDFQVHTAPSAVQFDDPDIYLERHLCGAPSNTSRYCNPEFDKLYKMQTEEFDVKKRSEITRKMERILLQDLPDDRGYYWMSSMGYWNRVQNWPPISGTTVYNFGKFEQVWCKGGKCM